MSIELKDTAFATGLPQSLSTVEYQASPVTDTERERRANALMQNFCHSSSFNNLTNFEKQTLAQVVSSIAERRNIDSEQACRDLQALLEQKSNGCSILLTKDRLGQTLLSNLNQLLNAKVAAIDEHWDRGDLIENLLAHLARSNSELQQGAKYATCFAGTISHFTIEHCPAEYTRQVTELSINGRCRVHFADHARVCHGKVLDDFIYFSPGLLEKIQDRDVVEALIQGGHFARLGCFQESGEAIKKTLLAQGTIIEVKGTVGLKRNAALILFEDMANVKATLSQQFAAGAPVSLKLSEDLNGLHMHHSLRVISSDQDWVEFYDPLGPKSELPEKLPGLVEVVDRQQARYRMARSEFESRINYSLTLSEHSAYGTFEDDPSDVATIYLPNITNGWFFEDAHLHSVLKANNVKTGSKKKDQDTNVDAATNHALSYSEKL